MSSLLLQIEKDKNKSFKACYLGFVRKHTIQRPSPLCFNKQERERERAAVVKRAWEWMRRGSGVPQTEPEERDGDSDVTWWLRSFRLPFSHPAQLLAGGCTPTDCSPETWRTQLNKRKIRKQRQGARVCADINTLPHASSGRDDLREITLFRKITYRSNRTVLFQRSTSVT